MVVLTDPVVDLAARVTALDLDGRVPDVEAAAQAALQVAHHVLRDAERAFLQHDVDAERHLV